MSELGQQFHAGGTEIDPGQWLDQPEALHALAHQVMCAVVRIGDIAQHVGHGADRVEALEGRILYLRIALQHDSQRVLAREGSLHIPFGALAPDRERYDHPRKQYGVADRQQDQAVLW